MTMISRLLSLLATFLFAAQLSGCQYNFDVTWNVPSHTCLKAKIPIHPEKFGIRTNTNQTIIGDVTAIFYNLGKFPSVTNNGTWLFGAVPQNGNLSEHLEQVEKDINTYLPDENFQGLGIIDFEAWRPVWSMTSGTQATYKNISLQLVINEHPDWNASAIDLEASQQFQDAGRRYMISTLNLCEKLRPKGKWGYYGYPMVDNYDSGRDNVSDRYMTGNDKLADIFGNSTTLYPSMYVFQRNLTSQERTEQVLGRIYETLRILPDPQMTIYPYFWYSYHDVDDFLSHDDLVGIIGIMYDYGMDGMVIWGGSSEVDSVDKCTKLNNYLETELGPVIQNLTNGITNLITITDSD